MAHRKISKDGVEKGASPKFLRNSKDCKKFKKNLEKVLGLKNSIKTSKKILEREKNLEEILELEKRLKKF